MRRTKTIGKIFGIALVFAMIGTMSGGWTGTALTLGAAPSAPTITSPGSSTEPGPTLSTLTPTLQWTAVSGADYYALAISKYPYGSSNVIYNPQQVYGTSHVVPSSTLVPGEKYRWNMQAHGAGGWSAVSNTLYFQAPPNQPPTCSITANPTSGQAPLTVTFTMSASDSDGSISAWVLDVDGDGNADYSGTGSPPSTETHTYTSPSPTSGYSVVLMVSDNNGATAFDTETVVVGVNSPPTCSLSATPSSGPAPLTVTFTMSASDSDGSISTWALDVNADGIVEYSGNGYPPSTKSHTYSTPGSYTALLMVSDDKGATSSASKTITVNQPALPDLIVYDVTVSPNPPTTGGSTTIEITIKNQGAGNAVGTFYLEYYFDSTYVGHVSINGLAAGASQTSYWQAQTWPSDSNPHTIKGVVDAGNAISESSEGNNQLSKQFTARANQSPTCSVTGSPRSGQVPLTVTFSMTASDPDGSISAWVLDVNGDGNADYSGTGSPPATLAHTYSTASPPSGYSVVLMVSDNNGATAFDTETVVVGVNSPPTCSLSATTSSGPAPLTVTFTMSASDSDGSITTWVLDPGDGNPSYSGSGSPPSTKSHTYSTPGSYTAILMVSDDKDATASDGRIISVGLSDTTPPTISIVSPSSGQTFATPTITVSGSASDNAGISKVEVKVGAGSWQLASGTTSWSKQVTLSPGSNTIYARATDTSGNIGETSVTVAYSPADTTPPTVSGVSPQNGDTDVAIDAIVTATFSEAMDSSTITTGSFTLAGSGVSGTVTYDPATYTATFTPEAVLAYNHTYTATLSTTITDFAGNPLAEPYTWSFTAEPTPVAKLVITSPLQITPEKDKYYVSDLLTANFTIKNVGNEPLILGKLVVGGRFNDGKLPDGNYPDFSPQSLTLDPGQSHQYEGTLELTEAGSYHFFCAYQTPDGKWNTSVDLGLGLTDGDRVKDITVEFPSGPYISQITRNSGVAGENVTIKGVNFDKVLKVVVVKNIIFIEPGQLGDVGSAKIISTTDTQIVCQVPVLTKLQTEGNRVEVTFGDSNDHPFHGINTVEFTYKEPVLESLSPSFGDAGTEVTLYGQNFGYEQVGLSPLGSWVSPPRSYLTFGATRIDEALRWTNDEIIIKAPSDYGTGLGDAKRVFDALTLIMKLANEGVKGAITFLIAGLINKALPDVKIEWELNEDGSLLLQFFKTAGAIGIEAIPVASIFVDINLIANFDLPVTVTTTGGTSEPSLFRFTKDLSQIHVEDSLIAHLASPGELRIYDSHGRVTGMVNGEVKEEIPDSSYYDGNAVIFSALDSYTYEVVGTDDGTYGLDITFVKDGNATTFSRTNTPIAPAAVHEYSIDWSALSQGGAGVAVHIDSNGDGVFEETKTLRPPVASFTFSPSNISVNEEINFDASQSSAADGEVVSYEWDFGDGNNSTGKIATHAYSMPGEYTVSLVVVDNDGVVSTQSRAIQVAERQGMPTWAWAIIAIGIVTMVVAVLRRRRVAKA